MNGQYIREKRVLKETIITRFFIFNYYPLFDTNSTVQIIFL